MPKRYYWKMNGYLYEVSEEQYFRYRKEQDRHNYLKKIEQEAVILSLDALGTDGRNGEVFIPDDRVNVEEEAVHNLMVEKLKHAVNKLTSDELLLIDLLYTQLKSERETALSQNAVNKRKGKLLKRLKKFIEK